MASSAYTAEVSEPQLDVFESKAEIVIAVGGIRSGKTHIGAVATILNAHQIPTDEDQCHAVTSPTFPMSKIGPEAKLHKLLTTPGIFPPWLFSHFAKGERAFFVRNVKGGLSKIRIFSGEAPDRWRGDAWLSWWGDESAYLTQQAWDVAQGRLADTNGRALFTTTPNGMNFIADLAAECTVELPREGYIVRESPDGLMRLVSWSSLRNVFLPSLKGFERLAARYDPDFYAQEVLAHFIARTGRVYRWFDRKKHLARHELPREGTIWVGQDFNVERMCSAFFIDLPGDRLHLLDEMEIRAADTHILCRRLDEWAKERHVERKRLTIVPDASSRKRQTTAHSETAKSDLEILNRAGFAIRGPKRNPAIKDRVNAVNGMFTRSALTLDPECKLTIEALEKQPWGDDGLPAKDGILDNRTDALGYPVWYRHPLHGPRAMLGMSQNRRAA